MSQNWVQTKSYDGVFHDNLSDKQFRTVLADWRCIRCNAILTKIPDGIGTPSECDCQKMNQEELRARKKALRKGTPL